MQTVVDQLPRLGKRELRSSDGGNRSHNVSLPIILRGTRKLKFFNVHKMYHIFVFTLNITTWYV